MYCSISDAWNQENTMANLAKRFNKEYFSNNISPQIEHFNLNENIEGRNEFDSNFGNVNNESKIDTKPKLENVPKKTFNTNQVPVKPGYLQKEIVNEKNPEKVVETKYVERKYSCEELVNKVLSCNECKNMLLNRLNINNYSISDSINNLFSGTNKEIIILILIGLIIIILLDLFLRIGNSLN